ncbi:MAG: phosphotransferase [Caldilinea sp.]
MTTKRDDASGDYVADLPGALPAAAANDVPGQLAWPALREHLTRRHRSPVNIITLQKLGSSAQGEEALKQFSYGEPLLIEYAVGDQVVKEVIHRIRPTSFSRERSDDRAASVWLDYATYNRLPRHINATDILALLDSGELLSLKEPQELLLVTAYQPGALYADDLMRLRDGGEVQPVDLQRAEVLASYLAAIHQRTLDDPSRQPALWRRRLRDLIGHGECIMGLTDNYPADFALADADRLRRIEELANRWRWRLKPRHHRLRQVHGDFHPFNILFSDDAEFHVLDRSRGEWGEPADDVSCMTINYIFFGLQRTGDMSGPFRQLYDRFWQVYLANRDDPELLEAIQPWYAWRALVVASPLWYPNISAAVRSKLLHFCEEVMAADRFDYAHPERYWPGGI